MKLLTGQNVSESAKRKIVAESKRKKRQRVEHARRAGFWRLEKGMKRIRKGTHECVAGFPSSLSNPIEPCCPLVRSGYKIAYAGGIRRDTKIGHTFESR